MNKASGGDGIPVELFQIMEENAVKVLQSVCQQIWKTQQWSQDWKRSVFILIPKKGNAKECSNYHTLSFNSHTSKVMSLLFNVLSRLVITFLSRSKHLLISWLQSPSAEDIKKRWQEYTEELYKKDLHDPDNNDHVITHLKPDILDCEVKWTLESITTKLVEVMESQLSYFKSWKMILWKCCTQHASKFGKFSSGHRTGKGQFSFQS